MGSSSVTSTHIPITLCHRIANRQITIFTVHVVCSRSWIISQPNAEVLYFNGCCFVDLFQRNNFAGGFLEFFQLTQEIPKTGLCHNVVGCKNSHLVQRRLWLLLCWQFAANHFIFFQLENKRVRLKLTIIRFVIILELFRFRQNLLSSEIKLYLCTKTEDKREKMN